MCGNEVELMWVGGWVGLAFFECEWLQETRHAVLRVVLNLPHAHAYTAS